MDVRRVESDKELQDALAIRRAVFVEEQGVPEDEEMDGRDDSATHVVAYDEKQGVDHGRSPGVDAAGSDGVAVGTGRLREYDEGTGKVERVAVVASRRGSGLGRALMRELEAIAGEAGYDDLVLHAQVPVVPFYERLGFETTSGVFREAGIAHREMRKRL